MTASRLWTASWMCNCVSRKAKIKEIAEFQVLVCTYKALGNSVSAPQVPFVGGSSPAVKFGRFGTRLATGGKIGKTSSEYLECRYLLFRLKRFFLSFSLSGCWARQ